MKKKFLVFILILVICAISAGVVSAQTLSPEQIGETFNKAILREQFANKTIPQYYRFVKSIWYFDNLGLSYFPSELVTGLEWEYIRNPGYRWYFHPVSSPEQEDWGLLVREGTGKVYRQMIYLDEPFGQDVIHGLDFPKATYLSDFYLYTDLFILDNYPEGTGSAYVYFSNSMLMGNRESNGILIDPRDGIYRAVNNYDAFSNVGKSSRYSGYYLLGTETHSLELIEKFDPSLYEGKTGCIGNDIFTAEDLDGKFAADLESVQQSALKDGLNENPSVYRIELVRISGVTAVYINGVFVTEFEDGIITDGLTYYTDEENNRPTYMGIDLTKIDGTVNYDKFTLSRVEDGLWVVNVPDSITDMVSWTVGPRLYGDGETVTMASGNFYLYGK